VLRKARDLVAANMRSNLINSSRSERVMTLGAIWGFLVIAASVTVMVVIGTGCDKPLVVWLSVYCGTLLGNLAIDWLIAKNLEGWHRRRACWRCVLNSLSFLAIMFEFAWMIVGNVWVYKSDDCSNGIWGLSLALVIVWYIKLALPVLVCLLFCISIPFVLYLMRYARPSGATPATDVTPTQDQLAHLPEIIQTEPNQECPICLSELELASPVTHMPCSVKHVFHPRCIKDWLRVDGKCPICRKTLAEAAAEEVDRP